MQKYYRCVVWSGGLASNRRPSEAIILRKVTSRERKLMTTLQAVFLGMMLAWTPGLGLLAFLLWREGIGLEDPMTEWRSRH
jgi:hypothetical protein